MFCCDLAGAIFGIRSFAPILGFLLVNWTNSRRRSLRYSLADISTYYSIHRSDVVVSASDQLNLGNYTPITCR